MEDGKNHDCFISRKIKNGIGEASDQALSNLAMNDGKYLRVAPN
jgi:hypothetical protein